MLYSVYLYVANRLKVYLIMMEPTERIELSSMGYKAIVLPLNYVGMAPLVGFEPTTYGLEVRCSIH